MTDIVGKLRETEAALSAERQRAEHFQRLYEEASRGFCGPSGMTLRRCKATDLCDCFDFPWLEPGASQP